MVGNLGRRAYIQVVFWVWFGAVAVVSLLPGAVLGSTRVLITTSGFWEHVLGYGVLALLAVLAFRGWKLGVIVAGVLLISIGFEVVQVLFLERTFNWMDVAGNGLGLGAGVSFKWLSFTRRGE